MNSPLQRYGFLVCFLSGIALSQCYTALDAWVSQPLLAFFAVTAVTGFVLQRVTMMRPLRLFFAIWLGTVLYLALCDCIQQGFLANLVGTLVLAVGVGSFTVPSYVGAWLAQRTTK